MDDRIVNDPEPSSSEGPAESKFLGTSGTAVIGVHNSSTTSESSHYLSWKTEKRDSDSASLVQTLDNGDVDPGFEDEEAEEKNKLVIDIGDNGFQGRPGKLQHEEEQKYDGTVFYNEQESAVYLVNESDSDVAIEHLPVELRSSLRPMDCGCDSGISFVNVVDVPGDEISDAKEEISERIATRSWPAALIRRYKLFSFGRDDTDGQNEATALSKNIPTFSSPAMPEHILMCLACKLSFGATKPFVNHAVLQHELVLLKEEKELLASTSAVLQKRGPDELRLSFLRPNFPSQAMDGSGADDGHHNSSRAEENGRNFRQETNSASNSARVRADEKTVCGGHGFDIPDGSVDKKASDIGCGNDSAEGVIDMTPADIALTVVLASELSASRLLQQVSQNALTYPSWNSDLAMTSKSESIDRIGKIGPIGGSSCGMHAADGKPGGGVECPKCDVVLGSSRSLGGHMTMTHSRNSCKTLKCPKCNWHYKYPETLEIHMKEKHPENEVNCVYCITNQAHPRLSRGETYTCGYKPFRCDICKYSTTTKGNLSIHMQSDKHLNNVQELQQGKLMTQAQAPGSLAVLNFGPVPGQVSPMQAAVDYEVAAGKAAETAALVLAQACTTTPGSKMQPTVNKKPSWRCDVCNYETNVARNLRIHMTSEKHAHNMNVLQQSVKQLHQTFQGFTSNSSSAASTPTQSTFSPLSALSSATIPKDSLSPQQLLQASASTGAYFSTTPSHQHHSITPAPSQHLTSVQLSRHLDPAAAFNLQAALLQRAVEKGSTYQCCVCMTFCADDTEAILNHIQQDRSQPSDGDIAAVAGQYYCNLCRYKTHLKANFQLHTKTDKHLQRLQLVNHVREGCPESEWRLKYLNPNNPVQLRCCACNHLVNSFHKLQMHTATLRHKCFVRAYHRIHRTEEERRQSASQSNQQQQIYYCVLCDYGARTKDGILNHLHSDLHGENVNRLGPLMDLSDYSGNGNESDAPDWVVVKNASEVDSVHLAELSPDNTDLNLENNARMNECSEAYRSGIVLEWNKERRCDEDDEFQSSDEAVDEGESIMAEMSDDIIRCCSRCSCSYETEAELYEHYATSHAILKHSRDERLLAIGKNRFGAHSSAGNAADEASMSYNVDSNSKQRTSAATGTQSLVPTVACPLCQKECGRDTNELETHLAQVHNVSAEGIARLLSLIPGSGDSFSRGHSMSSETSPVIDAHERPSSAASLNSDKASCHSSGQPQTFTCPSCSVPFKNLDDLYSHQSEVGHIEMKQTPHGVGYLCWWKGCNQYFDTLQAIQTHFREIHAKRQNPLGVTSDRHVYRYRCNRCSQAYPTMEKLQQHQLYHQMRASTTCAICSRTFRTIARLKEHVENIHINGEISNNGDGKGALRGDSQSKTDYMFSRKADGDLDEEGNELMEDEEFEESPSNTVVSESIEDGGELKPLVIDEKADAAEDYLNSQAMAETGYADPNRKFKCHRCKVAFTRQSYLSVHNRTVAHRRGDKMSFNMEKYLDPSRPFKCDVCKESFTQKNILLVHNNSVSHLRKLRQGLQEAYPNGDLNLDILAALSKGNAMVKCSSPSVLSSQSSAIDSSPSPIVDGKSSLPANSNKRFRCNTCDTYVTESTREIHLRSVKHQSRAAKLPQRSSGEPDLCPILGDLQSDRSRSAYNAKQLLNEALTKKHHQSIPNTNEVDSHGLASTTAPFTAQDAAAAAAASFQSAAALLSMAGFGPFLAAAQAAAYQELPGVSSTKPAINEYSPCKKTFPNAAQLEAHKEKGCKPTLADEAKMTSLSTTVASAIEQVLSNSNRFVRSGRGNAFRRLLEDYGFEVVMQFNEMQPQKRLKLSPEKETVNGSDPNQEPAAIKQIVQKQLANGNQISENPSAPEVKKCVCQQCDATFSSVWVLKAHTEQVHGAVVPLDFVEETSEEFKHAYEKKYLAGGGTNQQEAHSSKTTTVEGKKEMDTTTAKAQQAYSGQQQRSELADEQFQQQQQLLALNAMMQHFGAAAQYPPFASNQMAAAMSMTQFPFMGMPFSGFGVPNPFLPMMVPSALEQLGYGATGAAAAAAAPPVSTTSASSSTPVASSVLGASSSNGGSGFVQQPTASSASAAMMSQAAQNQKRARTRITDEQLKILREYFDINNSPTEEQIEEMSRKSGLALKVIKHWFRNTLFKERQRCKDSPYNFSIPPSYSIDLEEYEKTGEAKIIALNPDGEPAVCGETSEGARDNATESKGLADVDTKFRTDSVSVKIEAEAADSEKKPEVKAEPDRHSQVNGGPAEVAAESRYKQTKETPKLKGADLSKIISRPETDPLRSFDNAAAEETLRQLTALGTLSMQFPNANQALSAFLTPTQVTVAAGTSQSSSNSTSTDTITSLIATTMSPGGQAASGGGGGRRANRTRFTEGQIKALQEFFEKNAYPKDDDLEYLSQKLSLSPRVIVVWFQNARQKARKMYENQPSDNDERFHRTPGLNYQCKGCKLVFQRYYELIKHQKSECFRDEGGCDASASPTPTSSASTTPKTALVHHHRAVSPSAIDGGRSENEYRCVQCNITFTGATQFTEHMKVHASNPMLFMGDERSESAMSQESRKRGYAAMGDGSENFSGGDGVDSLSDDQDSGGAKRQRTQILPEQLDTLYKKYNKDANPSSRNLEKIAQETGLHKRVVQVWFQNTRAKERRGQLSDRQFFNKRCPFCGILYHSKQTMEAHMNSRHSAQLGKTEVNIDTLPDAEEVPTITTVPVPEALLSAARTGNGNDLAQSMLSFGMVPGTTTVPGPGRTSKTGQEGSNSSSAPLDLSRAIRGQGYESANRPSSVDRMGNDLGPPGSPSTGNSNEEAVSMDDYDDSRSAFDHDSPSPHHQVLAALARPQKRFRTHLTPQQVKMMKHLFQDYRTPTMSECEALGHELGLHKRVVQVWNARAKDRKAKNSGDNSSSPAIGDVRPMSSHCDLCSVAYSNRTTMQDHLFSKGHLQKVKALADCDDDTSRNGSPKFIGEQRSATEDIARSSAKLSPGSGAVLHQSRSQHKHQQQPQKRQASQQHQPLQDLSSSPANSMAPNFLPYMYAAGGLPQQYFANLASSMMYSGAFQGMYDPNIHGTPVNMLQIPPNVMKVITTAMGRPRDTSCRFTQDGLTVAELSKALSSRDRASLVGVDLEVGWACRRCTTVFQSVALFSNHQRMVCQSKDPVFKLVQIHYECKYCNNCRFGTQEGFKQHCQTPEHSAKTMGK